MPSPPKFAAGSPKIPHNLQRRRRGKPGPLERSSSSGSECVTEVADSEEEEERGGDQYGSRQEACSDFCTDWVQYGILGRMVYPRLILGAFFFAIRHFPLGYPIEPFADNVRCL